MNDEIVGTKEGFNWKLIQVILVVAPVIGYTLAYVNELGYCDWFNIPNRFISLSWNNIIISVAASLAGAFIVMFPFLMLSITKYSTKPFGTIERRMYFLIVIFLFLFIIAYRYLIVREVIYVIGFFIFTIILLFILPLFSPSTRKIKGYRNKLIAYDDSMKKNDSPFFKWFDLKIIVAVLIIFGAYTGAYFDGRANAVGQKEYLIPSTYPDTVVLRIYGDNLICGYRDILNVVVEKKFIILNTNDIPDTILTLTDTGQLFPREKYEEVKKD